MELKLLKTDEEIISSFDLMTELRPHLERDSYLAEVRELEKVTRYQLLGAYGDGVLEGLAGFKITQSLAWGKFLYVDDIVTSQNSRSKGFGKGMSDWLIDLAKKEGCNQFDLDSGVQRYAAHRFYFRERMDITCYHFTLKLPK